MGRIGDSTERKGRSYTKKEWIRERRIRDNTVKRGRGYTKQGDQSPRMVKDQWKSIFGASRGRTAIINARTCAKWVPGGNKQICWLIRTKQQVSTQAHGHAWRINCELVLIIVQRHNIVPLLVRSRGRQHGAKL